MYNKELTLANLTKIMEDLSKRKDKRKICFICGKQGVIQMEKAFYEAAGLSAERINEMIKELEVQLEDGVGYYFDGLSFSKFSYGK